MLYQIARPGCTGPRTTIVLLAVLGYQAWPGLVAARDAPPVDLRGPAPRVGFKFREFSTIESRRTDRLTGPDGRTFPVAGSIRGKSENLHAVEVVRDHEVVRYQTKVIRGETTFTYEYPGKRRRTVDRIDHLAGEIVVSERLGGGWEHKLLDADPSPEQQRCLARLRSPFEERDYIPEGKWALGKSWEVDATQIKRLLGDGVGAVSGKLGAEFVQVEDFLGDECAVVKYAGTFKLLGEPEDDLPERTETCALVLMTYRSLSHGITLRSTATMNMKWKGKMRIDGTEFEFEGNGVTIVTYRAKVE